jgi:hypothetical protein
LPSANVASVARTFRMRVKPGRALLSFGGGPSYQAGDEFAATEDEAAMLLRGKGRRALEVVEVINDPPSSEPDHPRSGERP